MTARSSQVRSRQASLRANEGTHELPVQLRSDGVDIDSRFGEKKARIFNVVDAGRLDGGFAEPRFGQLGAIVVFFQSSRDAAHPEEHAVAHFIAHATAHDHIRDSKASARFEDAKGLAQNAVLVGGEIDH